MYSEVSFLVYLVTKAPFFEIEFPVGKWYNLDETEFVGMI